MVKSVGRRLVISFINFLQNIINKIENTGYFSYVIMENDLYYRKYCVKERKEK